MTIVRHRFGKHVPAAKNSSGIIYSWATVRKHVPVETNKERKQDRRGTVKHGDLYSVRPEVIKELVQFIREGEP
jgi:hypothetical protein